MECRHCNQLGHLSFHCPKKTARHTETNPDEEQPNTKNIQRDTTPHPVQEIEQETTPADNNDMDPI